MADPKDVKGLDAVETEYAAEIERLLGLSHTKLASAPGTPEEVRAPLVKKGSEITKLADMSLRDVMAHPLFLRGVQEEIDANRHIWEPIVEGLIKENLGL